MQQNALFALLNPSPNMPKLENYLNERQRWAHSELTQDSIGNRPSSQVDDPNQLKQKRGKESGHRAGDWICNMCSNHNYSFREICNSCKSQTKVINLRESLSILTPIWNPINPSQNKPLISKKKLQLKSGTHFELLMRGGVENRNPLMWNLKSAPELSMGSHYDFEKCSLQTRVREESLNEFPFEKEFIFGDEKLLGFSEEEEDSLAGNEDMEIDGQTWKLLNFD